MAVAVVKKTSEKLNMVVMEDRDNDKVLYVDYSQFPSGSTVAIGSYWSYRQYFTQDGRATVKLFQRVESPIAKWAKHFNAKRHS